MGDCPDYRQYTVARWECEHSEPDQGHTDDVPVHNSVCTCMREVVPAFWGECGNYMFIFGPNSNSGMRAAQVWCRNGTGRWIPDPPAEYRARAPFWTLGNTIQPISTRCPGYPAPTKTSLGWNIHGCPSYAMN